MKIEDMQLIQRLKTHIFKFDFTILIALVLLLATSCDSSDNNEDTVNLHNTNLEKKTIQYNMEAHQTYCCRKSLY